VRQKQSIKKQKDGNANAEQIIQAKIEELKGRRSGELPEVQQETSSSLPTEE
jgi:hypothetical protein